MKRAWLSAVLLPTLACGSASDENGQLAGGGAPDAAASNAPDAAPSSIPDASPAPDAPIDAAPVVDASPILGCQGSANYTATFDMSWNATGVPNPHWSPPVGALHSSDVDFWSAGSLASPGVEVMAETGATGPLVAEVQNAINAGDAATSLVGSGIPTEDGSSSVSFTATPEFSQVTLVTMMAPSPDWFVGVDSFDLCDGNTWVSSANIELFVYDSGTDSGVTFTSQDSDTNPAAPISMHAGFSGSVGTLILELAP